LLLLFCLLTQFRIFQLATFFFSFSFLFFYFSGDGLQLRTTAVARMEVIKIQGALLDAAGQYLSNQFFHSSIGRERSQDAHLNLIRDILPDASSNYNQLSTMFSESLLMYTSRSNPPLELWW